MATKTSPALLFLILNLLLFTFTNAGNISPSPNPSIEKCPMNPLKLSVCTNVLNGLINIMLGQPPKEPCCTLIGGLIGLDATVCLCTALNANILGINLNLPISLNLLLNACGQKAATGFVCP